MTVQFTGILIASAELPNVTIPPGLVAVDHPHITLLSSELSRAVRQALRGINIAAIDEPFPTVTFGEPYIADNGTRRTLVCDCVEQAEIRAWLLDAVACLNLDVTVNESRVYHISVANLTGIQFDSIPDPWNHRQ